MEKSLFLNNKSKKSLPTIIRIDLHQKKALIPLESHNDFLELFSIKSKPCFFVPIAKTLVFDEVENIKTLLENAFIGKTLIIQTKSLENVKTFFRILSEKHQKIENFPRKKTFKFCHRLYKALKLLTHVNFYKKDYIYRYFILVSTYSHGKTHKWKKNACL